MQLVTAVSMLLLLSQSVVKNRILTVFI